MRFLFAASIAPLLVVALAGCTSGGSTSASAVRGESGAQGATGNQGPKGDPGPPGAGGNIGPKGDPGARGDKGDKGDKGDPGQVLVTDGGVVTGPQGPAGPAGASVTATAVDAGDPSCAHGGTRFTIDGGSTTHACNGAPGSAGAPGLPGAQGPAGPQGPPGQVVFLDGGVVETVGFAGFTAGLSAGDLGGRTGGHALCAAEFSGSHFCHQDELARSVSGAQAPTGGAWVDTWASDQPGQRGPNTTCVQWGNGTAIYEGRTVLPNGFFSTSYVNSSNYGCATTRPLACCFGHTRYRFRAFTAQTYTGNLNGRSGAHAICAAEHPGSHFCHQDEYAGSNTPAKAPASGAWVDTWASDQPGVRGPNTTCVQWGNGTAIYEGRTVLPNGFFSTSYVNSSNYGCGTPRPLACCD